MAERRPFNFLSKEMLAEKIRNRIHNNTLKATRWAIGTWDCWATARNDAVVNGQLDSPLVPLANQMNTISMSELNEVMAFFIQEVCRADGIPYLPDSLRDLVSGVQRYMREELDMEDVNLLDERSLPRKALDARCRELTSQGVGLVKKQAEPLSSDHERRLWESGILGVDTANQLQKAAYLYVSKCFGVHAATDHRKLSRELFSFRADDCGKYVQFNGFSPKDPHQERHNDRHVEHTTRQYQDLGNPNCAYNIIHKYCHLIPATGPFYRKQLSGTPTEPIRYGFKPVGINVIRHFIRDMMAGIGEKGYYTGHSIKVTCGTEMLDADEQLLLINRRTGHGSLAHISSEAERNLSRKLDVPMAIRSSQRSHSQPSVPAAMPSTMPMPTLLSHQFDTPFDTYPEASTRSNQSWFSDSSSTTDTASESEFQSPVSDPPTQSQHIHSRLRHSTSPSPYHYTEKAFPFKKRRYTVPTVSSTPHQFMMTSNEGVTDELEALQKLADSVGSDNVNLEPQTPPIRCTKNNTWTTTTNDGFVNPVFISSEPPLVQHYPIRTTPDILHVPGTQQDIPDILSPIITNEDIPEQTPSTFIDNEDIPEQTPSAIIENEDMPEHKPSLTIRNEDIPEQKPSLMIRNEDIPEQKPSLMIRNEDIPGQKPSLIINNEDIPEPKPSPILNDMDKEDIPKHKLSSIIAYEDIPGQMPSFIINIEDILEQKPWPILVNEDIPEVKPSSMIVNKDISELKPSPIIENMENEDIPEQTTSPVIVDEDILQHKSSPIIQNHNVPEQKPSLMIKNEDIHHEQTTPDDSDAIPDSELKINFLTRSQYNTQRAPKQIKPNHNVYEVHYDLKPTLTADDRPSISSSLYATHCDSTLQQPSRMAKQFISPDQTIHTNLDDIKQWNSPIFTVNLCDLIPANSEGNVGVIEGISLVVERTVGGAHRVSVKMRIDNTDDNGHNR